MAELIVVGAGIVGLSCAWSAQRRGWRVTLIDRDFEGDRASHGNAGGIAVGECAPLCLAGLGLQPLKWLLRARGMIKTICNVVCKSSDWRALAPQFSRREDYC